MQYDEGAMQCLLSTRHIETALLASKNVPETQDAYCVWWFPKNLGRLLYTYLHPVLGADKFSEESWELITAINDEVMLVWHLWSTFTGVQFVTALIVTLRSNYGCGNFSVISSICDMMKVFTCFLQCWNMQKGGGYLKVLAQLVGSERLFLEDIFLMW